MPFLTAQIENMLCLVCSWCTAGIMSRCRAAVRGCAIAARGMEGNRSSCRCNICLLSGIQRKLYKTMLNIAILACFTLNAVKTVYPHSLRNLCPVRQLCNNLHSASQTVPQTYWRYYSHGVYGIISLPLGCSIYYMEFRIRVFTTIIFKCEV